MCVLLALSLLQLNPQVHKSITNFYEYNMFLSFSETRLLSSKFFIVSMQEKQFEAALCNILTNKFALTTGC